MIDNIYTDHYLEADPGIDKPWMLSDAGQIRFNTSSQRLELHNGSSWIQYSSDISIRMSADTIACIEWTKMKMAEEKKLHDLLNTHPGLKELHDKFEMMKALIQVDNQET